MNVNYRPFTSMLQNLQRAAQAGLLAAALCGRALAGDTPIADAPLFTSSADQIQPNIMFILDNSGSMDYFYLPQAAQPLDNADSWYGRFASQCNGLAYDPNQVYALPVDHAGNALPMPGTNFGHPGNDTYRQRSLAGRVELPGDGVKLLTVKLAPSERAAHYERGEWVTVFENERKYYVGLVDATDSSARTVSISVDKVVGTPGDKLEDAKIGKGRPSGRTYYRYIGSQPRLGYTYVDGQVDRTTQFWNECASQIGNNNHEGAKVFQAVTVTDASPELMNYAIWNAYYRSRMALMTSGVSLALKNIDHRYRLGYMTINDWNEKENFLDIKTFDSSKNGGHKKDFYEKLMNVQPTGGTPLRVALNRAGLYYANKLEGQKRDPVQYSCQRNFTILSTDGYWNDSHAARGLDGAEIGDPDKNLVTPMRDKIGEAHTLADVAAYFYETDLRDPRWKNCTRGRGEGGGDDDEGRGNDNVCENNVPGKENDAWHSFGDQAKWQHMTTFTLGLGVSGTLRYEPNYLTSTSGDYARVVNGELDWPVPRAGAATTVDDLWHAAVNGRGQYFSAGDAESLARSLGSALNKIAETPGAGGAASTSSLQPVAGDNDIYVAQFTNKSWTGDVLSYAIDPKTAVIATRPSWSAQAQLEQRTEPRVIYYKTRGANALQRFTYENLKADQYNGYFDNFCEKQVDRGEAAKQCAGLDAAQRKVANAGENLVKYLAGDKSFTPIYRQRSALLGDIVNASPLFIGKPRFRYEEHRYQAFASEKASRQAIVLAAANDGMLHAFERETGKELWAYVPTFVMDKMFRLADSGYPERHRFLVDGTPQTGDVWDPQKGQWRTIVVGGLNAGGRGYYALDVTDPKNPMVLWEFEHQQLGLTFGNPIITKRKSGDWVVVFASGYNNTTGGGDGNGHLFVVDALKGGPPVTVMSTMTEENQPAGTAADPSGLARINAWVPDEISNDALRFYGGDLKGNVWRFDIDDRVGLGGNEALRLARLKDKDGKVQPVTTVPALGHVGYNGEQYPVVYVATGRYLGTPDVKDSQVQSVYAIKDPLTAQGHKDVRGPAFVQQPAQAGKDKDGNNTRDEGGQVLPVDWSTKAGWRVDFPVGGERVNVDPQLALETLYVGSNVPAPDICVAGGESFVYEFNFAKGSFKATRVGDVLVQGLTVIQLAGSGGSQGSVVSIVTRSDGRLQTIVGTPTSGGGLRRTSWRELVD